MSKNISKVHLEVLDKDRQELLAKLLLYLGDFVLAGGTALALHLTHRKSFDFDFFSSKPLEKKFIEKVSKAISIANISVDTQDELTFFTDDKIKLTFLHYPFDHAFPIEELPNGLRLFSIQDIAIKKAYTIGRRGEYRDYFDLYSIIKENYMGLKEVISHAKRIYGSIFEEKIFLEQLVFFDDLLSFDIVPADKPVPNHQEVKRFFESLVKKYLAF